jgi:probable phosphoglycerate mutase
VARALSRLEPELRSYEFAVSPQLRAQHTMRIVCDLQPRDFLSVRTDDRLRELGFGIWEGQNFKLLHQDPSYPADPAHHYHWCPPGGESYADGVARVDAFLRSLTGPTVIVSHGAVGRCLIGYLCSVPRIDITHLPMPQGCYCILENGQRQWIDSSGHPVP